MYSNKLAVAVKASGKVLREFGDKVYVPFGSEYTILIKNLNSVRVQVRVTIDGTDATEGTSLVIGANQELELQRFIKNGNLREGNRFKFIERTSKIENGPRGAKVDDGLIRIEYEFEKVVQPIEPLVFKEKWIKTYEVERPNPWKTYPDVWCSTNNQIIGSIANGEGMLMNTSVTNANYLAVAQNTASVQPASSITITTTAPVKTKGALRCATKPQLNETGITVAGSKSEQQFRTVSSFPVESTTHSLVIHLLGETETGKSVREAVTVKAKPKCTTCGHLNKATAKFCTECGTALEII